MHIMVDINYSKTKNYNINDNKCFIKEADFKGSMMIYTTDGDFYKGQTYGKEQAVKEIGSIGPAIENKNDKIQLRLIRPCCDDRIMYETVLTPVDYYTVSWAKSTPWDYTSKYDYTRYYSTTYERRVVQCDNRNDDDFSGTKGHPHDKKDTQKENKEKANVDITGLQGNDKAICIYNRLQNTSAIKDYLNKFQGKSKANLTFNLSDKMKDNIHADTRDNKNIE